MNFKKYQLDSLSRNALPSWAASLVNALLMCFILSAVIPFRFIKIWMILYVLVSVVRLGIHGVYVLQSRNKIRPIASVRSWLRLYEISGIAGGITWGISAFLLFAEGEPLYQAFLIFVIAGTAAGGAVSLSHSLQASLGFTVALILPFIVILLQYHDSIVYDTMALMMFIYTCMIMSVSRAQYEKLQQVFILTQEKEKLLRQTDDALAQVRKTNEIRTRFLANMSHEVRTPLNAIMMAQEFILLDGQLSPKNREYLEASKHSAESLLLLINDILDFSKIEAGRLQFDNEPFDLATTLEQCKRTYSLIAAQKGLQFEYESSLPSPTPVLADRTRILQILNNLLANALKFTKQGGVILKADVVHETSKRYEIVLRITDTGIGIAPENLKKIFQPFTQADISMTRSYGGTGLGLTICKELIARMDGKIEVESELDKGSTFIVRLPFKKAKPEAVPADGISSDDWKKYHVRPDARIPSILLAEDNKTNQMIFSAFMKKFGFDVDIANNGRQALDLYKKKRHELIFMDLDMPVMDGYEAAEAILKHAAEKQVKTKPNIYAVSASVMDEVLFKCQKAGMRGYVTKPLNPQRILEILKISESLSGEQES